MFEAIKLTTMDVATVSAIIAALVTVLGNAFKIDKRYRAILAMILGGVFVFLPTEWSQKVLTALIIGLTASGVYSQVKPRELFKENLGNINSVTKQMNSNQDTGQSSNNANNNSNSNDNSNSNSNSTDKANDKWVDKV